MRSVVDRNVGMRHILFYRSASVSRHAGLNVLSAQGFSGNVSAFGLPFQNVRHKTVVVRTWKVMKRSG
jgi:hypothetical protein